MKEASEVFKSIRYAKVVSKGKPHKSTDDEEHGTVGEKEYEDQVKHVKKMTGGMAEEVEQLDEMPGDNMDTRAVHQHLKKKGFSITRTSGGHDVFTHPEAKHHIPVPRHRQLKAPLVKGILKQSEVREEVEQLDELSVNKMLRYSSAAEKDRERLNKKWDAGTASRKEQERVIGREEGENRAANKIKQKTGKYPWQLNKEEVEQVDEVYDIEHMKYINTKEGDKHFEDGHATMMKHIGDEFQKVNAKRYAHNAFKENPHKKGTKEHKAWHHGADAAGDEHIGSLHEAAKWRSTSVAKKVTAANKAPLPQKSDRREFETPGKPVKVNESRAKDIAKMAARRQAGMKEEIEPEDSFEKTNTPAKRSLSKTAGMVKDLAKTAKSTKKEKPDTFQAEPELSSQIVKV